MRGVKENEGWGPGGSKNPFPTSSNSQRRFLLPLGITVAPCGRAGHLRSGRDGMGSQAGTPRLREGAEKTKNAGPIIAPGSDQRKLARATHITAHARVKAGESAGEERRARLPVNGPVRIVRAEPIGRLGGCRCPPLAPRPPAASPFVGGLLRHSTDEEKEEKTWSG